MNPLKGLILLYLISTLFISCTKNVNEGLKINSRPFSPYYFAIKNPTQQDYMMLSEYMNLYGPPVRYEAAILLAGYYVKTQEFGKAKNLLTRYIEKIDNRSFLYILGNMWLLLSYEKLNNERAYSIYTELEELEEYKDYVNALKAFCISISEPIYINNKSCLDRLVEKYIEKPVINNINEEESKKQDESQIDKTILLNEPVKIYINKVHTGLDLMNGALFALYAQDLDFEVVTEKEGGDYKYVIDVENNKYLLRNDENIDFSWDFNNGLKHFYDYNIYNFKNNVIIVAKEEFQKEAEFLCSLFGTLSRKVRTVLYSDYGFRDDLEGIYKKYDNDVSIICIGHEKDIVDFMPLIRFVFTYKIPVYAMIDCFTGLYLEKYYVDYFNYVNIYAFSDFVSNENRLFFNEYKDFYGIEPGGYALIGYDIMLYIASLYKRDTIPEFLSGIISIDRKTKEVLRSLKYYYIKNRKIQFYDELNVY